MSHFQCPLCGKHNSIRNYDPALYQNDVDIITYVGLGHAKGFEKHIVGSIQDDPELLGILLDRAREVVAFLEELQSE